MRCLRHLNKFLFIINHHQSDYYECNILYTLVVSVLCKSQINIVIKIILLLDTFTGRSDTTYRIFLFINRLLHSRKRKENSVLDLYTRYKNRHPTIAVCSRSSGYETSSDRFLTIMAHKKYNFLHILQRN